MGAGHNAAAAAIQQEFIRHGHECVLQDTLALKSQNLSGSVSKTYDNLVGYFPHLFGLIYHLGEAWGATKILSPIYLANRSPARELYKYMAKHNFDAVVTTHLYAMEQLYFIRRKHGDQTPFYALQTDYVRAPLFAESKLDGYFMPTQEAADRCAKQGIDPAKIHLTGIPVDAIFHQKTTKSAARYKLSLSPSTKIFLVTLGGAQPRRAVQLCHLLLQGALADEKIFILTGSNQKLKDLLHQNFAERPAVKILDFMPSTKMHLYMAAADVIIAKPGGLTSTEVAAMGRPLVHTIPIPGGEPSNGRWFAQRDMSIYAPKLADAARAARSLMDNPAQARQMVASQRRHLVPHSAAKIVKILEQQVGKGK